MIMTRRYLQKPYFLLLNFLLILIWVLLDVKFDSFVYNKGNSMSHLCSNFVDKSFFICVGTLNCTIT